MNERLISKTASVDVLEGFIVIHPTCFTSVIVWKNETSWPATLKARASRGNKGDDMMVEDEVRGCESCQEAE